MKSCNVKNNFKGKEIAKEIGVNLLKNIEPLVLDDKNEKFDRFKFFQAYDVKSINVINDLSFNPCLGHIDLEIPRCTIIYDLKETKEIDRIVIAGFYNGSSDYSLLEYELYLSDNRDTLFDDENKIITYTNPDLWVKDPIRNCCDQAFELEGYKGKYFAVKILKANPTDDVIRISTIGIYNDRFTNELNFANENLGINALANATAITEDNINNLSALTNGICFRENEKVSVNGTCRLWFENVLPVTIKSINVLSSQDVAENCKIYLSDDIDSLWIQASLVTYNKALENLTFDNSTVLKASFDTAITAKYIGFELTGCAGFVDQIVVNSLSRDFVVDSDKILNDDFVGFGVNCLPMGLMPEAKASGYNEVYMAMEKARIVKSKPAVVRLWFQPDWLITTRENYENGIYDFDSEKMKSVYYYLDAFQEAGSEVEFNFGWKASREVCDWFSLKIDGNLCNAAPADLDSFAKCCSATLRELIINRGYSNIKYLSFYNEPNYGIIFNDFGVPDGKPQEYYAKMAIRTLEQLKSDGMYDYIKFWGCEHSGYDAIQYDWTAMTANVLGEYADKISHHKYCYSYDELMNHFAIHKENAKGKCMVLSEYGVTKNLIDWNTNHISYAMAIHNSGYSGGLIWTLSGIDITDPCSFLMNNDYDLWYYLPQNVEGVNMPFYETCLQMRYIPNHSKAVEISVPSSKDVRAAAWTFGDDITIMIESKGGIEERILNIKLDRNINKPLYRHTFKRSAPKNGNAIIPPTDRVIVPTDFFSDVIDTDYQAVMYTTIPSYKQVALEKVELKVSAGESVKLNASLIDADANDEIAWAIDVSNGKCGSVDQNGVYTADTEAQKGTQVAVKAYIKQSPEIYYDAIITIE